MSASSRNNLSGYWSGEYTYAQVAGGTPFNIYLEDKAGVLSGTTLEPNTFPDPTVEELSATITGERAGQSVSFRKLYDPAGGTHQHPVYYAGEVNDDFTVIEGNGTSLTLLSRVEASVSRVRQAGPRKSWSQQTPASTQRPDFNQVPSLPRVFR